MTRSTNEYVLHRASERASAGVAAIALTFLTLLTVDARADEAKANPTSITVSYSDVAFGNTEGAANVYRKLKVAARRVCGVNNGSKDLSIQIATHACYTEALANAVMKIDRPTLTALHAAEARKYG